MRSTLPILICCLYALSAVEANPFSKRGSAEVQQDNVKAAKPLHFWSDDKSDDDSKDYKDDKWSKDDCASRSVSVLIGTSTYAIPCLQGDSIVNLNGLIPTPIASIASSSATDASSSAVSSSAVESSSAADSSSSEASSATESTTTTTDSTTTTTDTTTSASSSPTFTVTLYDSKSCTGDVITTSFDSGCFNHDLSNRTFSVGTTSTRQLIVYFYEAASCAGNFFNLLPIDSRKCGALEADNDEILSYKVTRL